MSALVLPVRVVGGHMNVLVAQSHVRNWSKPCDTTVPTRRFPGEFLPFGNRRQARDSTPLQTAMRELEKLALGTVFLEPRRGASDYAHGAFLFEVWDLSGDFVYCFLLPVKHDDAERLNEDVAALNAFFDDQCGTLEGLADTGKLWKLSIEERHLFSNTFRRVEWCRADELAQKIDTDKPFVDDWQKDEFSKYGCKQRILPPGFDRFIKLLKRLSKCVNVENLRIHSIETNLTRVPDDQDSGSVPDSDEPDECPDLELNMPSEQGQVRLLSYNLNCLPVGAELFGSGQGTFAGERLRLFLDRVFLPRAGHPDIDDLRMRYSILTLQELFASPYLPWPFRHCCRQEMARQRLQEGGYTVVTGQPVGFWSMLGGVWTDSGLVIAVREPLKVIETDYITFSAKGSFDGGAAKGAIWVRVDLGGCSLDVFNCHLQASHSDGGMYEKIRASQLEELRRFLLKHRSAAPAILTGDFNIDALSGEEDDIGSFGYKSRKPLVESPAYRKLLQRIDPHGNWVDLLKEKHGKHVSTRPPRPTYPQSERYALKHRYPQRLDYIFYRPGGIHSHFRAVSSCTRVHEFNSDAAHTNRSTAAKFNNLSDHFGIEARFNMDCKFSWKRVIHDDAPCPRIEGWSLYDTFYSSASIHGSERCLGWREVTADGLAREYSWLTYDDVHRRVVDLSIGLSHLVVSSSSTEPAPTPYRKFGAMHVAVGCDNCPEWLLVDLACSRAGLISVALNICDAPGFGLASLLQGDDIPVLVTSRAWVLCLFEQMASHDLQNRFKCMNFIVQLEPVEHADVQIAKRMGVQLVDLAYVEALAHDCGPHPRKHVLPFQPSTAVCEWNGTSETRSRILLTHQQLASRVRALRDRLARSSVVLGPRHIYFSYTSLAFLGERVICHTLLSAGGAIGFYHGEHSIGIYDDIRCLRPTFLAGSPIFFRELIMRLQASPDAKKSRISKSHTGAIPGSGYGLSLCLSLCFASLAFFLTRPDSRLGLCLSLGLGLGLGLQYVRSRRTAKHGVSAALGGRIRLMLVLCSRTNAALHPEHARFLRDTFDCKVMKSLLLTKAGGPVTLGDACVKDGRGPKHLLGVGAPLDGVELHLAEVTDGSWVGPPDTEGGVLHIDRGTMAEFEELPASITPISVNLLVQQQLMRGKSRMSDCSERFDTQVLCCRWRSDSVDGADVGIPSAQGSGQVLYEYALLGCRHSEVQLQGTWMICDLVETVYLWSTPLVRQVWCTQVEGKLMAVCVLAAEQAWHASSESVRSREGCDLEEFCNSCELRDEVKRCFDGAADRWKFPQEFRVAGIVLVPRPFNSSNSLCTGTFEFCRHTLRQKFSEKLVEERTRVRSLSDISQASEVIVAPPDGEVTLRQTFTMQP